MIDIINGNILNTRESKGYTEDFDSVEVTVDPVKVAALTDYTEDIEDIDPNYPITDELNNMDSFLSHYGGFCDRVGRYLPETDTIALYAVYMNTVKD